MLLATGTDGYALRSEEGRQHREPSALWHGILISKMESALLVRGCRGWFNSVSFEWKSSHLCQ